MRIPVLSYFLLSLSCLSLTFCLQIQKTALQDIQTCNNLNFIFDLDSTRLAGEWYALAGNSLNSNCLLIKFESLMSNQMRFTANNYKDNLDLFSLILTPYANTTNTYSTYWNRRPALISILDTDYDNYSIIYTCAEKNRRNVYQVTILGRDPTMPDDMMRTLYDKVRKMTGVRRFMLASHSLDVCESPSTIIPINPTPQPLPTPTPIPIPSLIPIFEPTQIS
jgi:hypothetical protein